MVVAANKYKILAALVLVSACHARPEKTVLSERFNVCAILPQGTMFQRRKPGPDFDLGFIQVDGTVAEVQIGGHPRFSHKVIKKGIEATSGFTLLGSERSDDQDKLLFAYERGDKEGPIYVMFMAPDLHAAEQILTTENWLVSCR